MNTEPRTRTEPAGGDGLLFLIAAAVVAVVTIEALFIAFSSYWLMSLVLLVVILAAVGVSAALVRLMDEGSPIPRRSLRPEPSRRPSPSPPRARPWRRARACSRTELRGARRRASLNDEDARLAHGIRFVLGRTPALARPRATWSR